jgi:hypothetical protein
MLTRVNHSVERRDQGRQVWGRVSGLRVGLSPRPLFNRGDGSRAAPRGRLWTLKDAWFVTALHLPVTRSLDCSSGPTAIGLYRPVHHVRGR